MLRTKLGAHNMPPKKKGAQPNPPATGARLYICSSLPEWQQETVAVLKKAYQDNNGTFPSNNDIAAALKANPVLPKHMKKAMPFANNLKSEVLQHGPASFEMTLPFNETVLPLQLTALC